MAALRVGKRRGLPAPDEPRGAAAEEVPLFAYGTLTAAAFVARLLERPVAPEPAELLDFVRVELAGIGYPVVLAAAGERTAGVLYRRLSPEDFRRLDAYEGVGEGLYFRALGRVVVPGAPSEPAAPAWVYLATERTIARGAR